MFTLTFTNLFVYMNRVAISGLLDEIEKHFELSEDNLGLMQTLYVISMMIGGPIFGYLGDRYNRKITLMIASTIWISMTIIASFIQKTFQLFFFFRGLSGIGDSGYHAVAPAVIGDYYIGQQRYKMLAIYYLALPFGAGLGYIIGAQTAIYTSSWRWGLRIVPCLAITALILHCFLEECPRGESEGAAMTSTNWKEDLSYMVKIKTYILSVVSFTCLTFVGSASVYWAPKVLCLGLKLQDKDYAEGEYNEETSSLLFLGIIVISSGIIGVYIGYLLSSFFDVKYPKADPLICGIGMLTAAPLVILSFIIAMYNTWASYFIGFLGFTAINLQPAVVSGILMSVIVPSRRSMATGVFSFVCHLFGDAMSPYMFGLWTYYFKKLLDPEDIPPTRIIQYKAFLCAVYVTSVIDVIGGITYLIAACFVEEDRLKQKQAVLESRRPVTTL